MDVNVNGIFNVVHAWLPALRQTRGNIINVASIASFVGVGGNLGYSPSKGAVKLFTQALARDLASDGIRVNAIAPGVIETPMTASTREDPSRLAGFMTRTPLGRVGQPEELDRTSDLSCLVHGVLRQRRDPADRRRISGCLKQITPRRPRGVRARSDRPGNALGGVNDEHTAFTSCSAPQRSAFSALRRKPKTSSSASTATCPPRRPRSAARRPFWACRPRLTTSTPLAACSVGS